MLIKFTEDQIVALNNGPVVVTDKGVYSKFPPYWYKLVNIKRGEFEELGFSELPEDLKEAIKKKRNNIDKIPEHLKMNYEDE